MAQLKLALVAEGLRFPEGPVAMADGSILLTEMEARRISRVTPDGKISVVAETGGGPNGLAIGPDGALYVTDNGGAFQFRVVDGVTFTLPAPAEHKGGSIQRIDLGTGAIATLYTQCGDRTLSSPNDLVFDRQGGFWFTDFGAGYAAYKMFGGLFYATPDGASIVCARDRLISPNGVGLSPDEKTVYAADTLTGRLWAFEVAAPGKLKAAPHLRIPGRVVANVPGYQLLDSMAIEASGKVCVATILAGGVAVFGEDGSVEHLAISDPVVTNICFGGADMRDAWITAAGTGRLYKTRWPRPGLKLNFNA
jgi:gluconolactonase